MKELADRLVAMSPEPPPFPEEVTVTQRDSSRPSPILVFAGAALVVLILAAIPLLLARGGGEVDPVATTTSTVSSTVSSTATTEPPVTTTTVPATSTTGAAETTTTTAVATEPRGVTVFLTQSPESSFTGNPALVPFFATTSAVLEDPDVLAALRLLTADDLLPPEGFETVIPDPVEVVGVTRADQVVTVEMNQAFVDGAGGLLADFTMLNQLIFTAGDGVEISEVLFTVGGEPVTAFGSEGLDISRPLGRDAFLDQLNSVNVDLPVQGQEGGPLVISGFANVFEATVSMEVVDAGGEVVQEDFATATCGTGCWGAYSFTVDYPFAGGETIRLFWHSPEDGSPSDIVSIPVLWNDEDGWDLIGG